MSDFISKILDILPYELNYGNATTDYPNFSIIRDSNTFSLLYNNKEYVINGSKPNCINLIMECDFLEKIESLVNGRPFPEGTLIPLNESCPYTMSFVKYCADNNLDLDKEFNNILKDFIRKVQ